MAHPYRGENGVVGTAFVTSMSVEAPYPFAVWGRPFVFDDFRRARGKFLLRVRRLIPGGAALGMSFHHVITPFFTLAAQRTSFLCRVADY